MNTEQIFGHKVMHTIPKVKNQPHRRDKTPRRNDPCPCGSGKKAKKCCLNNIKLLATLPPEVRRELVVQRALRPKFAPPPLAVTDAFEDTAKPLDGGAPLVPVIYPGLLEDTAQPVGVVGDVSTAKPIATVGDTGPTGSQG